MIIANYVIETLINSVVAVAAFVGILIVAGMILGILKNINYTYIYQTVGLPGVYVTSVVGTPIHELGHAVMCLIFDHKITDIKLLQFNDEQSLGYVAHAYNRRSLYQNIGNFFIGIGPIISGTISIILLLWLLLPSEFSSIR